MNRIRTVFSRFAVIFLIGLVSACGGGDSGSSGSSLQAGPGSSGAGELNAPQASGNTATDGLNWTNFRRQQLGLSVLARAPRIDAAAQGHSDYQRLNNVITHEQAQGKPGFTGVNLLDRLTAANYHFTQNAYAYGEVISASGNASGANASEDLIAAIYHRFVMFEPRFREAGAGAATGSSGYTYFTLNLAADGLGQGLARGQFVVYPADGQSNLPVNFFSDNETPDPVPDRNEVGYPVSVHANVDAEVVAGNFTIRPRGGDVLAVRRLTRGEDANTPRSVAAIVPLAPLRPGTTYDVQFTGAVDGISATRNWSFTTR
ncbi:MAG: CAP domain-containing protein [Burkholderiales bacterium]|nr:CAP domain-containing protein [Burkholderiales bacterium]